MGELKNYVSNLHNSTKRNYFERMQNEKVKCMDKAQNYGEDYWDGDRKYGYGGYKFISGRWKDVAQSLIDNYSLKANSKVLDVGCGKGYLLYEMLKIQPQLDIYGFDISDYAIKNAKEEIKEKLFVSKAEDTLKFNNNEFDLTISLGVLHNLNYKNLVKAVEEIKRVSKNSYIMVESYTNNEELFNLQCWALTCKIFLVIKIGLIFLMREKLIVIMNSYILNKYFHSYASEKNNKFIKRA